MSGVGARAPKMKGLIDSIRKLGMVRVAMLAGVTLGIVAAFVWLELQGPGRSRMTVLAADLDPQSVQQITTELTGRKIPYRLEGGEDSHSRQRHGGCADIGDSKRDVGRRDHRLRDL